MPKIICEELKYREGKVLRKVNEITIPENTDVGNYRDRVAYDVFRSGVRYGHNFKDRRDDKSLCCWGPDTFYQISDREAWTKEVSRSGNLLELYGIDSDDPEDIPVDSFETMKEFLVHIGFDHTKRAYIDPDTGLRKCFSASAEELEIKLK